MGKLIFVVLAAILVGCSGTIGGVTFDVEPEDIETGIGLGWESYCRVQYERDMQEYRREGGERPVWTCSEPEAEDPPPEVDPSLTLV